MNPTTFTDGATDGLAFVADRTADTLRTAGRSARRGLDAAATTSDVAVDAVESTGASVSRMVRDHPIRTLTGVAVLGAVAGALILRRR